MSRSMRRRIERLEQLKGSEEEIIVCDETWPDDLQGLTITVAEFNEVLNKVSGKTRGVLPSQYYERAER